MNFEYNLIEHFGRHMSWYSRQLGEAYDALETRRAVAMLYIALRSERDE